MPERGEIDITLGLASAALDLQPWEAPVDGLINRGARVDGAAIRPHTLVPRLARQVVGFTDQRLALAPLFR